MINSLPILNRRFAGLDEYRSRCGTGYRLLPLRFLPLDDRRYVLTNLVGEYAVVGRNQLAELVEHRLSFNEPIYDELKSKHFLIDGDSSVAVDLLAVKYRTKQSLLSSLTGLFIFVVTLRCDHSCPYCQVSRQSEDRHSYDMSREHADQAIKLVFESPSRTIKVEFQGGESLLNFDLIRHIVLEVERRNVAEGRDIQFVIATNLAYLTDEILGFCRDHQIHLSTSLDGPKALHNGNRPRPGSDSYERTISGIARARDALGPDSVSALMTTTATSLSQPEAIVDEYLRQGFDSIFLRSMSPFGFAVKTGLVKRFGVNEWLDFYRRSLSYILELNAQGFSFREDYSSLLLRKILSPFPTAYVDLQSPAGLGIAAVVFNYDGGIYASDEARMLAETGDRTFELGKLGQHSLRDVLYSDRLLETLSQTMTEVMPMCSDCGFQPYCGSDPVHHYATQGDIVGFKPNSDFCRRNMSILRHLITLLEDDPSAAAILRRWGQPC